MLAERSGGAPPLDHSATRTMHLDDETYVTCPWCFQHQLLYVDPETRGRFVQDCDVCCRPWNVSVERDESGAVYAHVERG